MACRKKNSSMFTWLLTAAAVLYVGFTSDLYQRVLQHRKGTFEGFTSRYGCSRLVWFERYGGPLEAIAREKQIKRWRREKKAYLIETDNPTWEDLSQIGVYRIALYAGE
ncbi:MAG: putative endonuclease containing a domain [Edaphobacter sp.]|nr:putative endonuclease containing a domain [Edaphobacter sp.]